MLDPALEQCEAVGFPFAPDNLGRIVAKSVHVVEGLQGVLVLHLGLLLGVRSKFAVCQFPLVDVGEHDERMGWAEGWRVPGRRVDPKLLDRVHPDLALGPEIPEPLRAVFRLGLGCWRRLHDGAFPLNRAFIGPVGGWHAGAAFPAARSPVTDPYGAHGVLVDCHGAR